MKKPENLESFVSLINGMVHRERFVFPANNALNTKYEGTCFVEVYNTILLESKNLDRNITIHLVNTSGEILNKKAKLHRLWNMDFFKTVYSMFKTEKVVELLELSE